MAKAKAAKSKGGRLSANPDDADSGGFLNDVKAKIVKVQCVNFTYPDKDGNPKMNDDGTPVKAPGALITYKVADQKYEQFYSNGGYDQRRALKDGTGFMGAPNSNVKGSTTKGSKLFHLIASLVGHGFPKAKFDEGDYTVMVGTVVHLIAQPEKSSGRLIKARGEGGDARTFPVVSEIYAFPWGKNKRKAEDEDEDEQDQEDSDEDQEDEDDAEDADEGDEDSDDEGDSDDEDADDDTDDDEDEADDSEEDESDDDDDKEDSDDEDAEESDESDAADPISDAAEEFVVKAADGKKKGVTIADLVKSAAVKLAKNKSRRKIIALMQDAKWLKSKDRNFSYDAKAKAVKIDG